MSRNRSEKGVLLGEYDMDFLCPYCKTSIDVDLKCGDIRELECPYCQNIISLCVV